MVRRWIPALVLVPAVGAVWWWAVLRLMLKPEHAGLIEGAVAAGGWGLSLLPVHVTATARSEPAVAGQGGAALRTAAGTMRRLISGAWPRRRSGGGSGRS